MEIRRDYTILISELSKCEAGPVFGGRSVTNIDKDGEIRPSRQAVLEGRTAEEAVRRDSVHRSGNDT